MPRELQCEICGSTFTCGLGGSGCWCAEITLSEENLEALKKLAKDCVCPSCLSKFSTASKG